MKGIKKVFLGLVFMTLFCVGFNVSAKAAAPTVSAIIINKDGEKADKWTKDSSISWIIDADVACFPDVPQPDPDTGEISPAEKSYKYTLVGADTNYSIKFIRNPDGSFSIDEGKGPKDWTEGDKFFPKELAFINSNKVKDIVDNVKDPEGTGEKSYTFTATENTQTPESTFNPVTVTAYVVVTTCTGGPDDVEFSPKDPYLLPGASVEINASSATIDKHEAVEADGNKKVYKAKEWTKTGAVTIDQNTSTNDPITVTMPENNPDVSNVIANYGQIAMYFDPDITPQSDKLHPLDESDQKRKIDFKTFDGCKKYESGDLKEVTINGQPVEITTWAGSIFYVKVHKDTVPSDASDMIIEMKDGNKFHRTLTILAKSTDEHTIRVKASPTTAGTVTVKNASKDPQETATGTDVSIKGKKGDSIFIIANPIEGETEFLEWTVSPSGAVTIDSTIASQDFNLGDQDVTITATFLADVEPIDIDEPIRVTKDHRVYLSSFTDGDPDVYVDYVKTAGKYSQYIKAGFEKTVKKGSTTPASNIYIDGENDTDSKEEICLNIHGEDVKVLVYDLPSIKGSDSKIVVQMPEGDKHDAHDGDSAFDCEDIKKTKIKYTGDGDKTDTHELDSDKKWSINWLTLSKKLKDDYDYDCDTVTMRAYPMNSNNKEDKDVYAEIKLYKIKLDESGGAKYTINDEDVSDYFYAADCLEYRIKSKAKDGGTFSKWDNSNNDNYSSADGGTFKPSSAKTFKAIYTGSNTTSSSYYSYSSSSTMTGRTTATGAGGTGGSGSDYDDVPKTGESKTDIWILWSVLLISILGAGFMIYKRFGLVRAIAEADREEAEAVQQEMREKQEKEKENVINTLKGLRKL